MQLDLYAITSPCESGKPCDICDDLVHDVWRLVVECGLPEASLQGHYDCLSDVTKAAQPGFLARLAVHDQ